MNLLNSALIAFLDMQKFSSKEEIKLSIESFYEEAFERDFEKMQSNPSLFEESERKIKIMIDDYIQLRNLKFFKVGQIVLVNFNHQKYIGKILEFEKHGNIKIGNLFNIISLEKLQGSLAEMLFHPEWILQILHEDL